MAELSNKDWAQRALEHTKTSMRIGSRDKVSDLFSGRWVQKYQCVTSLRDEMKQIKARTYCEFFQQVASKAERLGCGNCGEQAAVAYYYLRRNGVANIAMIGYLSFPDDHSVVVIGFRGLDRFKDGGTLPHHFAWIDTRDTWVCDPWNGIIFPGLSISGKIGPLRAATLICGH